MKMTEMMDGEQFQGIKADLHQEAMPVKGGSPYDMSDSQKKMARMGQQIKASLSPRSSDIKWEDDQQWLDALKFSEELIRAGENDDMDMIIRKAGLDKEKAGAIMTKVAGGNVDITKSVPDPEGDSDGIDKLAQAIKKA
tara:strand:- start:85 stop:501 length:417 start_codon:yes stop_codon:yes gene_type:complete